MYLHALATAVPERSFTQAQCWEIFERSQSRLRLTRRSRLILHSILRNDHGISNRNFAVPDIENVFDLTPDQLNAAFRLAAPELAGRALKSALGQAGIVAAELDALLICTCTGYLCPGLTSYVAEQLGLRSDAILQDLVGLGCGAAIPTIRSASQVLAAHPDATIACVAVEVCSAAFYLDDDPGVLISACLFSDGAAATIWRSQRPRGVPNGLRCFDFQTLHRPAERDKLRFETRNGKLRNLLHDTVPEVAAKAAAQLWETRGPRPVTRVVAHSGGLDVLESLGRAFPGYSLEASARVLRDCGNMSSPSVIFALAETLRISPPDNAAGDMWLISFGAGFSAHSCRIGN
jgi:alkylresorcinol/alkylpyrone synthase